MAGFSNGVVTAINVNFGTVANRGKEITALGQVLMGSGNVDPSPEIVAATLVQGQGVVITPALGAPNTITISSPGAGLTWIDRAAPVVVAASTGNFFTAVVTLTLPAAPSQGDVVAFDAVAAAGCVVQANAGQSIRVGSVVSAVAGSATSTAVGDTLYLVYRAATTTWNSIATSGNWSVV